MTKLSEQVSVLRKFNKKASKYCNIRVGSTVYTPRGIGIVTYRSGDRVVVAVRPGRDDEVLPCYRYQFDVTDVKETADNIDITDRLYEGAWYWIINEAIVDNQEYEAAKHRAIYEEYEPRIICKRTERVIDMGTWGSTVYRRYIGVNKNGQPFDFELNTNPRLCIPYGDRIMYALGINDGYITDMGTGLVRKGAIGWRKNYSVNSN